MGTKKKIYLRVIINYTTHTNHIVRSYQKFRDNMQRSSTFHLFYTKRLQRKM